ncbi:MAG: N-acetyl-gamma-glutamyl-phosphate reductase, partial [Acetobacteraceae bacterium]|nr:N-acetyl-gamma-glutamyl-phosphate reductase [Acetobacteraceae bacterium]
SVPLYLDTLNGRPSGADLRALLADRYAGTELITVAEPDAFGKLEPEAVNGTDRLELRVFANERQRQAVLVARLDNLGKGASGAAVQNLKLMLGIHAEAGGRTPVHA